MKLRLKLSAIYKSYDNLPVLDNCSYSFDKAGVYVIMGKNGSGKSTLLRVAALLESSDSGAIEYYSDNIIKKNNIELKRSITLVLPKIGIFDTSVFGNVSYGLKLRGIKGQALHERVKDALDFVGLFNKLQQNALTLSSGETQRLGIARAIAINPDFLFLDEPTSFIDEENTKVVENIIHKLKCERASTIVMTTHNKAQAERLGDTILVLNKGALSKIM